MIGPTLLASPVASTVGLGVAQVTGQTAPPFKVGIATRAFVPAEPYEWRGSTKQALATMIWYPADLGAEEKPQLLGPPDNPLFDGGPSAVDAALVPTPAKFSLILLSHDTSGTGGDVARLGTALALSGNSAPRRMPARHAGRHPSPAIFAPRPRHRPTATTRRLAPPSPTMAAPNVS
jgi:hypothetical protein